VTAQDSRRVIVSSMGNLEGSTLGPFVPGWPAARNTPTRLSNIALADFAREAFGAPPEPVIYVDDLRRSVLDEWPRPAISRSSRSRACSSTPTEIRAQWPTADEALLRRWFHRALEAGSLDEVFLPLHA